MRGLVKKAGDVIRNLLRDSRGAGIVEYGLIIVTIAIIVFATLMALSGQLNTVFTNIKNKLQPQG